MKSTWQSEWRVGRRSFLSGAAAAMGGCSLARLGLAGEDEASSLPRATSGDRIEPNWEERLTITVGPDKADVVGATEKPIQAAVDYVARLGGGTVRILPGTFKLRNSVYLQSNVRILGSGLESVLVKEPSHVASLAADSDWFDQEITLAGPHEFHVGDAVCLRGTNPDNNSPLVIKRTLVARSGDRFKLDKALRENAWLMGSAAAHALFPILSGEFISDVAIENLALDGNKEQNDNLDGNYAGCIFLQDCANVAIKGVTARNYNGDGISWQICHDVTVEDCHSHDNTGLGLHPGSGSQRPVILRNKLDRNDIGIFFCWGVKNGLAEGNTIDESGSAGISIGHRDTHNRIVENVVRRSGQVGVLFRPERGKAFAPHQNLLERNSIVDSGPADGVAIDVQGETESITIDNNEIRESREPMSRVGVRIGAQTKDVRLKENKIEGFAAAVTDLRQTP